MITHAHLKKSFQGFQSHNQPHLRSICLKSLQQLLETEFPTKKLEKWKYTSLKKIKSLDAHIQPTLTHTSDPKLKNSLCIMGHNGEVHSSLPKGISILPIRDFIITHGEKYIKHNEFSSYFGLLNKSFLNMGCVIHVSKDTKISTPLELMDIYHITHSLAVQHIIILEPNAQLNLLRHVCLSGKTSCFASLCDKVILDKGSKLDYTYIQNSTNSTPSILSEATFDLSKQSHCTYSGIELGSTFSKRVLTIELKEESSSFDYRGLSFSKDHQALECHIDVQHRVKKTKSTLLQKNVAIEKSRGSYTGSVFIDRNSPQSSSSQINKNLVIGTRSEINTVPNLSVNTSDVIKAVHGATTGQLDKEASFYLQSRGFSKEEAIQFLLKSFLMHIASDIQVSSIRDYICNCVESEIHTKSFNLLES